MDFKNERLMMSEEEARNRAKELLKETQVDLITQYMFLEQQCKKQKELLKEIYKELFNTYQKLKKENEEVTSLNLHQVDKIQQLKEEIEEYKNPIKYFKYASKNVTEENKQLKDKLSKIETLIINHNRNIGDIYYKYNSKFLKSELKQRILEIVYEVSE